jgi:hypothetical protein
MPATGEVLEELAPEEAECTAEATYEPEENNGPTPSTGPSSWQQAQQLLNEQFGGEQQVMRDTPYGPRIIDNLTGR